MSIVQPLIWYKFDPANPTLNSGSLGSSGNLTLDLSNTVIPIATSGQTLSGQTGCLRTTAGCNVPFSFTVPGMNAFEPYFGISFWYKNITGGLNTTYMSMNINNSVNKFYAYSGMYYTPMGSIASPNNMFDQNWHHCSFRVYATNWYFRGDNNIGYTNGATNLYNAPVNNVTLNGANVPMNGYLADFRIYGFYGVNEIFDNMYKIGTNTNIGGLSGVSTAMLIHSNATYSQLLVAGRTLTSLLANNYTILQLYTIGATIAQLRDQRTTLQLIADGITIDNLLTYYSYTQLFDNESVTKTHFDSAGKTIQNVVAGGYTVPSKLVTAGYTVQQIVAVPYTVTQMVNGGIMFSQLINGGVTSTQFSAENYSVADVVNGGATNAELLLAGYSLVELQSAGILPAWNIDMSANHLIKSYVKDFVDVSGSIVLRENSNLYIHGNVETAGNLLLNRLCNRTSDWPGN